MNTNNQPVLLEHYLSSKEFLNAVLFIGKSQNLHIDQIENIRVLAEKILHGELKRSNFIGTMRSELGIDYYSAVEVADMLNDSVFSRFRELMRESGTKEDNGEEDTSTASTLETPEEVDESHKDSILDEIENPTPIAPKIHKNENVEIRPDILPKKEVSYPTNWMFPGGKTTSNTSESVKKTENPLGVVSNIQPKTILEKPTSTSAPKNPIPQKNYATDPYRELPE